MGRESLGYMTTISNGASLVMTGGLMPAVMTNGQFSVTSGFWVLPFAVQTVSAPILTIVPAGPGNATISWLPDTPGFVLQESLSLSPANWTDSASGATNPVTIPTRLPGKFYRLKKP